MNQLLLIESIAPSQSRMISEASTDGKSLYLSGVFMQGGIKNRNQRVYPVPVLSEAVGRAVTSLRESNGIMGELDHPQTLSINLDRVSHVITDMRMENNNALGRMRILSGPNGTPMGNIARALIESGVRIGVSSRGRGGVDHGGAVSDFDLVTVDIVATPSAPGATPSSMYESLDSSQYGREAYNLAESIRHDPAAQKFFNEQMRKFLAENLFASVKR